MTFYSITKRLLDILGAIVGIIIFSPVMIFLALWIKKVSPGPVFADMPSRSSKNGRPFTMYKFRSMFPGAHEKMLADPVLSKKYHENSYKLDPDPRLIPGALLYRKYSLDELAQFFNILKGDMGLVGPRPYFVHELIEQEQRHPEASADIAILKTVKPGLTGPWQVGGRSEIGFVERAKIDASYAKKQSILYDLWIILKTPYAAFSGKGTV